MIYTKNGTPLNIAPTVAGLRLREIRNRRRAALFVMDGKTRAYKVAYDKTGAPYRVFRGLHP